VLRADVCCNGMAHLQDDDTMHGVMALVLILSAFVKKLLYMGPSFISLATFLRCASTSRVPSHRDVVR
jgi:hypothetical protein